MNKPNKYIDLAYLQDFSNGNEAFIREIISISVEQTRNEMANLRNALDAGEYKRVAAICHKLRSSMGFMGIDPRVIQRLKEIETWPNEKMEELKTHTERVIADCALINAELSGILLQN